MNSTMLADKALMDEGSVRNYLNLDKGGEIGKIQHTAMRKLFDALKCSSLEFTKYVEENSAKATNEQSMEQNSGGGNMNTTSFNIGTGATFSNTVLNGSGSFVNNYGVEKKDPG